MAPARHAPKAVERFVFFSDAVFAFALTLLAASLKLPDGFRATTREALVGALAQMIPTFVCYAITFIVVAQMWIRHHRLFEKLCDYDRALILLNFALLLCVSFLPFAIDVMVSSGHVVLGVQVYTGVLAFNGLASLALGSYTRHRPGLLSEPPTRAEAFRELLDQLTLPLFAGVLFVAVTRYGYDGFFYGSIVAGGTVAVGKRVVRRRLGAEGKGLVPGGG
jgi:uncharacterized membrane protein